jgi:hypothetical protein
MQAEVAAFELLLLSLLEDLKGQPSLDDDWPLLGKSSTIHQ